MNVLDAYRSVWLVDFEFQSDAGERQVPVCLVALEFHSGRLIRLFQDEMRWPETPPYPVDTESLFVAYYASAELGCHLALGWPMPLRVLDLCAEFKCKTSGLETPCGKGLLGALAYHGLPALDGIEKDTMRELALRGGPYTDAERHALLDYCQSDVDALAKLLPAMAGNIDLPRALLRGRYMAAVARMEWTGTPIDTRTLALFREHWTEIQVELIRQVDADFGVYDGQTFKAARFANYLARHDIAWPMLDTGRLCLDDDTFKRMAGAHPQLRPLRELRKTLAQLRLNSLEVGADGRNRCALWGFGTKTSRNAPSTSNYIFGLPAWSRGLIKPGPGRALADVDYEQQEFGIAAALSGDLAMQQAYASGDPYLTFAKQAKAVPQDATEASHGHVREQYKVCSLAVQYGMRPASLAVAINQPEAGARELLRTHRDTYPMFWSWVRAAVDRAMLTGSLHSVFGWQVHVGGKANPRSLMNFPMQANGAEMLRLACCLMTEWGIDVCAPVHDAVLVESSVDAIDDVVRAAQTAMLEASKFVLDGFGLRTDAAVIQYPDRYMDKRGASMWEKVTGILQGIGDRTCCAHAHPVVAPAQQDLLRGRTPVQSYVL
ncbi:MAG: DNA polymerase [Planctomycetota bacterium]|nr:DNA polymerase [Planctomycetota bacterium]